MAEPRAIHSHAIDDLRFIRDTMARAGQFSAIPGWGGVTMGATAIVAAAVAGPLAHTERWLAVWLIELGVAILIALVTMVRKARRSSATLLATPTRRFALVLLPPLAAGAVLTGVFVANGLTARLPGCWLLLYGVSGATGGALSVRPEAISLASPGAGAPGLSGHIRAAMYLGNSSQLQVMLASGRSLEVQTTRQAWNVGDAVSVTFDPECCYFIAGGTLDARLVS